MKDIQSMSPEIQSKSLRNVLKYNHHYDIFIIESNARKTKLKNIVKTISAKNDIDISKYKKLTAF